MQRARAGDTAKLILLGAIWGASFIGVEVALRGFEPLTIAALRITLAAIALLAIARLRGEALPRGAGTWALLAATGALSSAVPFYLIGWGQQHIDSSLSAILMGTSPLAALVLAHFATPDERINATRLCGVALGFGGILALVGVDALQGMSASLLGQLAVMLASVCYVTSALLARRLQGVTALSASALVLAITACYLLPVALWLQPPAGYAPRADAWGALLFLGLVPTALAYLLRFQLIASAGVTFMAQVAYLIPLFGVLWGWLLLGEQPGERAWLALALILGGIYLARRGGVGRARAAPPRAAARGGAH